jgi:hypothetical protein
MAASSSSFARLPDELFVKILTKLSYGEISAVRGVSRKFNATIEILLNDGFASAKALHADVVRWVRSRMPRRESERRTHAFAGHAETLMALDTRICLLNCTYQAFIKRRVCCFIPGKVIDELFSVERFIRYSPPDANFHAVDVLREFRDLSSLAMEWFDEHISPSFVAAAVLPLFSPGSNDAGNNNRKSKKLNLSENERLDYFTSKLSNARKKSILVHRQRRELVDCERRITALRQRATHQSRQILTQNRRLEYFRRRLRILETSNEKI